MTLVKIGVHYVNPTQVVRISPVIGEEYVVVYLSDNMRINYYGKPNDIVAKINESM